MVRTLRTSSFIVMVLIAGMSGCSDDKSSNPTSTMNTADFSAEVATDWFRLSYDLVQAESYSPPVASRAFGYAGVALYESVVWGMPAYQTLAGQVNDLESLPRATDHPYHWPTVANAALATVFEGMFEGAEQSTLDEITSLESRFNTQFAAELNDEAVFNRSLSYGQSIGLAILEWSRRDGYTLMHNCDAYTPTGLDGHWEPTPPAFASALEPCWGQMRPFALLASDTYCDPGPPPAYSEDPSSQFMIEATEVYDAVNHLTPEQQTIAEFWADNPGQTGTPPGHSIMIAVQVLEAENAKLDMAAETFSKVGMAVADAFIACWWSKYEYDLIRPITCIRDLMDPSWNVVVVTPPFPEYTSGHSVQSGASAQVLTDLFGDDYAFVDRTHSVRGFADRSFDSFYDFADEAAISRLYGGIHFRAAIDLGVDQGKCVGQVVSGLQFKKSI